MVFSSVEFLFLFLPAALVVHWLTPRILSNAVLFGFSLLFYASGRSSDLGLLIGVIAGNWLLGLLIESSARTSVRQAYLTLAIALDLGVLAWFKFAETLSRAAPHVGATASKGYILPLGISFFVFHAISYTVDVYRRTATARRSPIDFGLYIAFFPQLIAGPIVRYRTIAPALGRRSVTLDGFASGIERFLAGLAKKTLIANPLGRLVDQLWLSHTSLPMPHAWLALVGYTLQIYFDFSGYSDMALGLARMFGFPFPENFNYPYQARSIRDFWRRWHMTLSNWFRDYLYLPLGGSRGSRLQTSRNLCIVFLLCGLWHGANTTFILWGALHGAFLSLERGGFGRWLVSAPRVLAQGYALVVVAGTWVIFRSNSLGDAGRFYRALVGLSPPGGRVLPLEYYLGAPTILALVAGLIASTGVFSQITRDWPSRAALPRSATPALRHDFSPWLARLRVPTLLGLMILSYIEVAGGAYNPFIYYHF